MQEARRDHRRRRRLDRRNRRDRRAAGARAVVGAEGPRRAAARRRRGGARRLAALPPRRHPAGAGLARRRSAPISRQSPDKAACFRFRLADRAWQARRSSGRWRRASALFGLPYGDQGLLVSRRLYDEVGGYRPLPLMEDVDLVRRIGRRRLVVLDADAWTTAERWRRDGWLRRSARNLACLGLYGARRPARADRAALRLTPEHPPADRVELRQHRRIARVGRGDQGGVELGVDRRRLALARAGSAPARRSAAGQSRHWRSAGR